MGKQILVSSGLLNYKENGLKNRLEKIREAMQEAENLIQNLKKDCQQEDVMLGTRVDEIGELMKRNIGELSS